METVDLVRQAQGGHKEAFAEIVRRHQQDVFRFLYYRLGRRVDESASAAQEVFLRAWAEIGKFRFKSEFKIWLFGIAWNVSRLYLKNIIKRQKQRALSDKETALLPDARVEDFRDALAGNEVKEILWECLHQLPDEERAIIILHYLEEPCYVFKEIARILGLPESTVKTRAERAKARLFYYLKDKGVNGNVL